MSAPNMNRRKDDVALTNASALVLDRAILDLLKIEGEVPYRMMQVAVSEALSRLHERKKIAYAVRDGGALVSLANRPKGGRP